MAEHTRFPWKWDGDDLWHFGDDYKDPIDPHRFTGIKSDKELWKSEILQKNRDLIVAIPEMLQLLHKAKKYLPVNSELRDQIDAVLKIGKNNG